MSRYKIAFNLAWRKCARTQCDHERWEWFGQAGPFRVIKMRKVANNAPA